MSGLLRGGMENAFCREIFGMPRLLEILNNEMKDLMLKYECFKMMINEELVTWNSLQVMCFQCQLRVPPCTTMDGFIISTHKVSMLW